MRELVAKGYAHNVPTVQMSPEEGDTWYIPHHGVNHPHEPGKIWVVFDCSAKFMGLSLNSMLYKGPDSTNSLVGVLTRFRKDRVAVMADIETIFYQVWVPDHDSLFLHFLWWDDRDIACDVQEYQTIVNLFGAILSPACTNFALRQTVEDNKSYFPTEVISCLPNVCLIWNGTWNRTLTLDMCLKPRPPTHRSILSVLSSIFNPLGFVAPFTLVA